MWGHPSYPDARCARADHSMSRNMPPAARPPPAPPAPKIPGLAVSPTVLAPCDVLNPARRRQKRTGVDDGMMG